MAVALQNANREELAMSGNAKDCKSVSVQAAILTGGGDRPYALGLAEALIAQGVSFHFIASDELDDPHFV